MGFEVWFQKVKAVSRLSLTHFKWLLKVVLQEVNRYLCTRYFFELFGTTIICNGGLKTLRFTIWIKKSFNPWKEIFDFVCDRNSLEEVVHEGLKIHNYGSSGNSWSKIVKFIEVHDELRNKWSRLNLATIVYETTISPFLEPCEVN